jgi:hypothetical protein
MRTAAWMVAAAIALSAAASGCATTARATAAQKPASEAAVDGEDEYTMPTNPEESTRLPPLTAF